MGMDHATALSAVHGDVEGKWSQLESRLKIIPGKQLIARINEWLQSEVGVTLTTNAIVSAMRVEEIPAEMSCLIKDLSLFIRS